MSKIKLITIIFLFALTACYKDDPYLYDRVGFDQDGRPVVAPNPNAPVRVTPDYYYRQPTYPSYYQAQPYRQNAYQGDYGGSRYYSNPYAMPPQQNYPYYDGDQYYVPPTYYNNAEPYPKNSSYLSTQDKNGVGGF